ncbi:MAG: hypothetical protein ACJ75J_04780 [Cytophagaceae bacterium]
MFALFIISSAVGQTDSAGMITGKWKLVSITHQGKQERIKAGDDRYHEYEFLKDSTCQIYDQPTNPGRYGKWYLKQDSIMLFGVRYPRAIRHFERKLKSLSRTTMEIEIEEEGKITGYNRYRKVTAR